MTETNDSCPPKFKFTIISTRTNFSPTKHVVYTVRVLKEGSSPDQHPCLLERRYTEFLDLYTSLCQEFPDIFTTLAFPKKAVVGNFSQEVITHRCVAFEHLLRLIVKYEKVRESSAVINFFLQKEFASSFKFVQNGCYVEAAPLLENNFYLLNKFLTPRNPRLLRLLCLLVACCHASGMQQTKHFAMTAVQRFEAVSDTDLLRYYVPLLQLTVGLLQNSEKDLLQERLCCMKRRGMKVDGCPTLLEAVVSDFTSISNL